MALHRDIFWIGRQWAVTGFGMQAINQKHEGQFDIPIDRLWDDDRPDGVRQQKWFNPDDFNKGLEIARARHPKPAAAAKPQSPMPATLPQANAATTVVERAPEPVVPVVNVPAIAAPETAAPPDPAPSFPDMRILGHPARLSRLWHVRRRK